MDAETIKKAAWRYEIQYGPDGEANYAWLYKGDFMVATMRTHHAQEIVAALAHTAEKSEPDAWMHRLRKNDGSISEWVATEEKRSGFWMDDEPIDGFEQVPLYRHPPAPPSDLVAEVERLRAALRKDFCVLFLDGRNEHGTHVIPSFPRSFDIDEVECQAEAIMAAAEKAGFSAGDHIWAEFHWVADQVGEHGQIELAGYWDFDRINVEMTSAALSEGRTDA